MIQETVRKLGARLEQICQAGASLEQAFAELDRTAASVEEQVVVEVMHEVHREQSKGAPPPWKAPSRDAERVAGLLALGG